MSYIENTVSKNETIMRSAKISKIAAVPSVFISLPLIIIGIILIASADIVRDASDIILLLIGAALALIGVVYVIQTVLRMLTTELAVTTKKIIGKSGILRIHAMESPLNKINNISVNKSVFGRIFNYGKIVVSTSSGSYNFDFISGPDSFRAAVTDQIEEYDNERVKKQAEQMAAAMNEKNE